MNKLIFLFIMLIFYPIYVFSSDVNNECYCYYFNYDHDNALMFFKPTAEYYANILEKLLNVECTVQPFSHNIWFPISKKYAIVIVGEGNPEGLFLTHPDDVRDDYRNSLYYKWDQLVSNINASIVIIDACYSGYAQDYPHPNIEWLITSTYKENSWNIIDSYGKNVSSLSAALRCKYDDEYQCPLDTLLSRPCRTYYTLNECQLNLIINGFKKWGYSINLYDWEYPSMGTCMMNNVPCSYILH